MPTPGSNAGSRSDWPMPRMYALIDGPKASASWLSCTLGASRAISVTLVWPRAASASALTAVIASGVDCTLCCWYCAVTVTSSRPPVLLAAGAEGASACAFPPSGQRVRSAVPKIQQSQRQSYAACETRSTPTRYNLPCLTLFVSMLHRINENVPSRPSSVTTKQHQVLQLVSDCQ